MKAEGCSGDMKEISVVFGHIKIEIASVICANLLGHLLICEFLSQAKVRLGVVH